MEQESNINKTISDNTGDRIHRSQDINGGSVDPTERDKLLGNGSDGNTQDEKKRKLIKWGIIGGIALIIIVLAIVLPLTLGGGDNPPGPRPPPSPVGPTPLPGGLMNPYSTVGAATKASASGTELSGELLLNLNSEEEIKRWTQSALRLVPRSFLNLEQHSIVAAGKPIGVDWRNKNFFGVNNDFKRNLSYTLQTSQADQFRVKISTANETRF